MNKLIKSRNKTAYLSAAILASGFAVSSMPTWAVSTIDTSTITAGVADAATAVGVIGAAVVLIVLGVKVFKWIARAL